MDAKLQRPPIQIEDREFLTDDQNLRILDGIQRELESAFKEHPRFPIDPVLMVGIVEEEVGESMQAAIDFSWNRHDDISLIQGELEQAAAMCMRTIAALDNFKDQGIYDAS